jgi:CRP-like cAMP-binding protein
MLLAIASTKNEIRKCNETRLDIPQILSRLPLFQELTPAQLKLLEPACRERRLSKGAMLFQKGDPAKGFFVVVFGQVKLAFPLGPRQREGGSDRWTATKLRRGGDVPRPALPGVCRSVGGQPVAAYRQYGPVFELLETDPLFARRMLAGLSMRLHSLVQDVETYSLRSSAQRVVGYLLQHCPQNDAECEGTFDISLPTSKQVIASRLNLTPETLSRIFHDLDGQWFDRGERQADHHQQRKTFARI